MIILFFLLIYMISVYGQYKCVQHEYTVMNLGRWDFKSDHYNTEFYDLLYTLFPITNTVLFTSYIVLWISERSKYHILNYHIGYAFCDIKGFFEKPVYAIYASYFKKFQINCDKFFSTRKEDIPRLSLEFFNYDMNEHKY